MILYIHADKIRMYEREVKRMNGKVKWFNNAKGYGFIEYNDNEDIFVHYSAIKSNGYKSLNEGDIVHFDLINTSKGLQARDVFQTTTIY